MKNRILYFNDKDKAASETSDLIINLAEQNYTSGSRFSIALAGGSAPGILNRKLAEYFKNAEKRHPGLLKNTYWFFGDERAVPPEDNYSNYKMQKETLLDKLKVPEENIFRIKGELGAEKAADEYRKVLENFFSGIPVFNIILLGIGPDGHTASLFPGKKELKETELTVVKTDTAPLNPEVERITLTLPVINSAENILFFTGIKGKENIINKISDTGTDKLPFRMVKPSASLYWYIFDDTEK
jgi:6-phosphogluconolactonase